MPTHPPEGEPPPAPLVRQVGGDVPPYRSSTAPALSSSLPSAPLGGALSDNAVAAVRPPPVGRALSVCARVFAPRSWVEVPPTPLRFPIRQRAPPFAPSRWSVCSRPAPVTPAPPSLVLSSSLPCAPQRGVPFQTTGAPVRPLPLVGLLSVCARYPPPHPRSSYRPRSRAPPKGGFPYF